MTRTRRLGQARRSAARRDRSRRRGGRGCRPGAACARGLVDPGWRCLSRSSPCWRLPGGSPPPGGRERCRARERVRSSGVGVGRGPGRVELDARTPRTRVGVLPCFVSDANINCVGVHSSDPSVDLGFPFVALPGGAAGRLSEANRQGTAAFASRYPQQPERGRSGAVLRRCQDLDPTCPLAPLSGGPGGLRWLSRPRPRRFAPAGRQAGRSGSR